MNDTPAALDTLITHFRDTGRKPSYYDLIITGDLGYIGKEILAELAETTVSYTHLFSSYKIFHYFV